ncbi:MAG: proline racemase family protein [Candidatus Bipolaricaulaceae bacterium]
MNLRRWLPVVDTHTAGEPTRVVLGGIPPIPGASMAERMRWLEANADDLRTFLVREPRGHADMFAALVVPPADPTADVGLLFLEGGGYLAMCGHATIGAVTALVSLGWTTADCLVADTPAGLVRCRIVSDGGRVSAVAFRNVPSFYLGTVSRGKLPVDIAYGGNLFALVDADLWGLELSPGALIDLVRLGLDLRTWVNGQSTFRHPVTGAALTVELVEFYQETPRPRNVVVFGQGQVDRSPCGTGLSAKLSLLHARGAVGVGDAYRYQGILGTEFVGAVVSEVDLGGARGIIPEVTGSAHVVSMATLVLEEGDPLPNGFSLAGGQAGVGARGGADAD